MRDEIQILARNLYINISFVERDLVSTKEIHNRLQRINVYDTYERAYTSRVDSFHGNQSYEELSFPFNLS